MGQEQYITERKKGQHLRWKERIKIEALSKAGLRASQIAMELNMSKRQINRELQRGKVELRNSDLTTREEYSAEKAQQIHDEKGTHKGPSTKMKTDKPFMEHVAKRVKAGDSPYAAIQRIKNEGLKFCTKICSRTLYNYISAGYIDGVTNKDLPRRGAGKKRGYRKVRTAPKNALGTSISQRAESIETREEFGHWEMDLVCGKQGTSTVLLVLTERKTRLEMIRKLPNKEQKTIINALLKIEKKLGAHKFAQTFKTITTDNGSEFLNFVAIETSGITGKQRTKHFFCHPYSSWERGSNENANGMIRRKIPKGVDIAKFSHKRIAAIEAWMNEYPRRILGGLSAAMAAPEATAAFFGTSLRFAP